MKAERQGTKSCELDARGQTIGEGLQIPITGRQRVPRAGPGAAAVVVLLASILFTAPVRAALPAGPSTVSAEASPQLFATMCALYAAGFEAESSTLGSDAEVSTLRSQLLALHGPAAEALRAYYRGHVLANPGATMSRYITFALVAGPPPNFALTINHEDLPPDALALEDFSGVLAEFYQEAQLDRLWMQLQPGYDRAVGAEREPVGRIVLLETGYLREILRPGKRSFTVYAEPLVGSRTNVRNMGDRYAVVLNPGVDSSAEIRHAFLHFMLDPLPIRYGTDLKRIAPLYDAALRAPRLPFEFHDDFSAFVTECVVHAVELRIRRLPAAELAVEVNSDESEGYVLVRPLIRALEKFEASEPPMSAYFPDLIHSIDVGTEFSRLKTVAFAPASNNEDAAAATATAGALPGNLTPELAAMLVDGDRRIAAQDPVGAASAFQRVLDAVPGQPRALYGMAVATILQGQGEHAREFFEQVVGAGSAAPGAAPDPVALAWSHIYLGRMDDLDGNREQALVEYRAAIAVAGAPEAATAAAQKGVEEQYQPAEHEPPVDK
jgi:Tetratricopeptide repeat